MTRAPEASPRPSLYHRPSCSLAASDMRSLRPGRVEDDVDTGVGDALDALDGFCSTWPGSHCAAGQAGAVSVIRTPTTRVGVHDDVVDEPEVVDVDRNFRVEHGLDGGDDRRLERSRPRGVAHQVGRLAVRGGGVCVWASRAGSREAASWVSSSVFAPSSGRLRRRSSSCARPGWRTSRVRGIRARPRRRRACRGPRADRRDQAASSRARGSESKSASASATVLPLTASVISDADAFEIAQPDPSKPTCGDAVALEGEVQRQPIAAERVVSLRRARRVVDRVRSSSAACCGRG